MRIKRRPSRVVSVGGVLIGGDAPITVQSMTTAKTHDVETCLAEINRLAEAGADIVVAHMGLTTSGSIGAKTAKSLQQSADDVQRITDAAKGERADVLVLCHGGPIARPEDAQLVLHQCQGVDGFYGASSMERLPTETALTDEVRKFSKLTLAPS